MQITPETRNIIAKYKQKMGDARPNLFHNPVSEGDIFNPDEPQILFLGTSAMKPGVMRGASAIYLTYQQCGLLMDCAEGSYGQLWDHLGSKELVDEALLKTRCIFITHIHGDH